MAFRATAFTLRTLSESQTLLYYLKMAGNGDLGGTCCWQFVDFYVKRVTSEL